MQYGNRLWRLDPAVVVTIEQCGIAQGRKCSCIGLIADRAGPIGKAKMRDSPAEIRVPLSSANAAKPQAGRQYIQSFSFQLQ